MTAIHWIILAGGSVLITAFSWKSLRSPWSHGFYRFFAWEFILLLLLLNVKHWFVNPFVWHQIVAWTLLFASFVPLGFGVHALRARGKPTEKREGEPSLLAFEKTTELVTSGIYKYIRHPLYCSLLLLAWGIFFKLPSLPGTLLVLMANLFLILTAKADERECAQFFGDSYRDYMRNTKMFIPYIF